jgi:hypothetical protein
MLSIFGVKFLTNQNKLDFQNSYEKDPVIFIISSVYYKSTRHQFWIKRKPQKINSFSTPNYSFHPIPNIAVLFLAMKFIYKELSSSKEAALLLIQSVILF